MSVVENVHIIAAHRRRDNDENRHYRVIEDNDSDDIDVIGANDNSSSMGLPQSNDDESLRNLFEFPMESDSSPEALNYSCDKLRRSLKYYFMSPIDKWKAKGRLPWKLGLQILKIIIVTLQLVIFGINMSHYLDLQGNTIISLRQLLLIKWDPLREVMAYPPAAGPYAFYDKDTFYHSIDHSIRQFANISEISVGSFGYQTKNSSIEPMSAISFCQKCYAKGMINPTDFSYNFDNKIEEKCLLINNLYRPGDEKWNYFQIIHFLNENNFSIDFNRLITVTVQFPLRTIYINSVSRYDAPECYDVDVMIRYDNTQHSGQILTSLSASTNKKECDGNLKDNDERSETEKQIINWFVIIMCLLSAFLCCRSLIRGQMLRQKTVLYFRKYFGKELCCSEKLEFIDGWILMIIINDVMIILGSIIKIVMEQKSLHGYHYNYCSILLGFGNLLVWCGLLRYLGFFQKYNILIITIKHSLPHVMRFLLCAIILYGGFCFCGWLVLGPYHIKFRTLSRTSECLFALMNGDDLFATFAIMVTDSLLIWWFSRLYLYGFIALFIYVVLSLFISIIMESYETIKDYYQNGFPLNDLQKFISQCPDNSSSYMYRHDDQNEQRLMNVLEDFCSSFRERIRALIHHN